MSHENLLHIDLFSGIGGFALAADRVFGNVEHVFCEIDPFCQEVLKKHWPTAKIHEDIRTLKNDTKTKPFILTGGFPCQPFSEAGRRKGTADDRHLWPEMLRVIREFHPRWVIGENVGGFITWNEGMVLEQVHLDLESEGYEVQAFVIPACAVNAPHRRDRVWIIAHSNNPGSRTSEREALAHRKARSKEREHTQRGTDGQGWNKNWVEIAARLCRMDDGVPRRMDRNPRLKALGNAIVPQIAEEIMKRL